MTKIRHRMSNFGSRINAERTQIYAEKKPRHTMLNGFFAYVSRSWYTVCMSNLLRKYLAYPTLKRKRTSGKTFQQIAKKGIIKGRKKTTRLSLDIDTKLYIVDTVAEAVREAFDDPDFGLELSNHAKRRLEKARKERGKGIPLSEIIKKYG